MYESNHCRACFKLIDIKTEKTFKLNEKLKNYEFSLGSMLSECTGIEFIIENQIICTFCKQNILNFYKFKQTVIDADQKFKELTIENDFESPPPVQVEVKMEDIKMEIDALEPEYLNNDDDDPEIEEKKTEIVKKKEKKTKKEKSLREQSRRRRYREPSRKENLEKYKRNAEGLYECPKENCPGLFKNMGHMEMHLENKHPDTDQKTFPCESCEEEFPTLLLKRRHVLKVHTPRPYTCDICGKNYPIFDSLRTHIYHHVKEKREKDKCACTICGKLYVCESNMLRHRKEVHFPKELLPKPYVCSVCGTRWVSKSKLGAHMRIHAGHDFYCDICSKGFSIKGSLTLHMQTVHNPDRLFFCDICGKTYKTKYNLRDHQASHTDERPFKCSSCPAMFKSSNTLHTHEVNVHVATGPISCDICGKLCKNKSSLKSHSVLHSSKEFPCKHCNKTYKVMDTLKRHIQRVHMGLKKRHECSVCLKNLWSRKHIADHIEECHMDVITKTGKSADELVRKYWTSDPGGTNLGEIPPKGVVGRPVCV